VLEFKLTVLALEKEGNNYGWLPAHETWGAVTELPQKNIFSTVAIGAKTIQITLRKQDVTLDTAVLWGEKQLFITAVNETGDRHHVVLTAALIDPVTVTLTRDTYGTNDLMRQTVTGTETVTFPAYITEKYMGYTKSDPQLILDTQYVLICPKAVTLEPGKTVAVNGKKFTVLVAHELDEHKNEYEAERIDEP